MKRIFAMFLVTLLVVFMVVPVSSSRAVLPLAPFVQAFSSWIFSMGSSMALNNSSTGRFDLGKSAEQTWEDIQHNVSSWADLVVKWYSNVTTADPTWPMANHLATEVWADKLNEEEGTVELTKEDVEAFKAAADAVAPDGFKVMPDTATSIPVTGYTDKMEYGPIFISGAYGGSMNIDVYGFQVKLIRTSDGAEFDGAVVWHNFRDVRPDMPANYFNGPWYQGYLVEYDSEAYWYCLDHPIMGPSEISGLPGYLAWSGRADNALQSHEQTVNGYLGNIMGSDAISSVDVGDGVMEFQLHIASGEYFWWRGWNAVDMTIKPLDVIDVEQSEYDAMIAAWADAIAAGQADGADAIALPIVGGLSQLENTLNAGIGQNIEATNAGSRAVVDAINKAIAAINSLGGELDLSRMTLGQVVATKFPFCVPFDLVRAFQGFGGGVAQAPHWTIPFAFYKDADLKIDIDLAVFEPVAVVIRYIVLVSFAMGLLLVSRPIVKG